ncbi:LysR family transcriptional regulator [Jannaschia seohaensis]|uniref:DNA-binding transcriptional LysR family regulator n=1 Tax=Jannaschia seohaensis TaxID=475081 RepID=A0A2Y9AQA6_9RHOB|nr:LysR family transcriptional regulator [Jannaschia seohaensis]PWJ20541.1 DNA-binding transcriptional LysR family regulator [Jannaschia seohaensis]SSA44637.1 DNA-binding transcriptional regulator, LysR family [Jannaschia seohaensis]
MDRIEGLRTFVAAVEAGSFTAAADRLGISKKLVSKYVGQLETVLGTRLLSRTTRSLGLTRSGERVYPRAVALLADFDELLAETRAEEQGLSGTLRIAAPVAFGELYLHDVLSDFAAEHPALSIDLQLNDRFVDLAAEGFDLALRIGALEDSALRARRIGETALIVVGSPDYFARAGRPAHPDGLRDHVCIRDANIRGGPTWPFEIAGQVRAVPVTARMRVNSAAAVRLSALRGDGLCLCPDYIVGPDIAAGRLERVLSGFPSGIRGIHVVYGDAPRLPARTRAALDMLAARFKLPPWRQRAERGRA